MGAEAGGTGPARLLIADDHALIRDGLRSMLGGEPDFEIVGEASNGREALELCRALRPDLVLMDVRMPEMDGLEATRAIKREHPEIRVLIVTMHENPDYAFEAIKGGAAGYVLKDASRDELITAVREALEGGLPMDPNLAARLLRRLADETRERARAPVPPSPELSDPLTPGELEGYLARLASLTAVVRWNGVPLGLQEAAQRAVELGEESAVAAHGADLFVTAG